MIADNDGISRAQLAREAGLSKPAVSELVDELVCLNFVKMAGERKSNQAGRKPVCLELNSSLGVFLTVAFNKEYAEYMLFDFSIHITEKFEVPVKYRSGCIKTTLNSIFKKSKVLSGKNVLGIFFILPAATNSEESEISSTVLDIEADCKLIQEIKSLNTKCAKVIVNETISYVYAEQRYARRESKNMIFIEVSEGVGAGIVIENKVFRGVSGSAGEFGHMSIDKDGKKCCCGRRGCIEIYVSKPAILRKAVELDIIADEKQGYAGIIKEYKNKKKSVEELFESSCRRSFFRSGKYDSHV